MDFLDQEIAEVSKICHSLIENSKIVTCIRTLIRIDLKQTHSRQLTICIRFPVNYPNHNILIELKSKTLCCKLLDGLTNLCEQKAKEYLGGYQIIEVLKFLDIYLKDNPLSVVFDEIACLKKLIITRNGSEIKLRQKTSTILLTAKGGQYFFKLKAFIPEDYPLSAVSWPDYESNLPVVLVRFLNGQAREIARQCVEPPLRQTKMNQQPFLPKPSLQKTLTFLIEATSDFHIEICPICKQLCLPTNSDNIVTNDLQDEYVERVFCGHIYHQGCLRKYLQEPPFLPTGKLCPAIKQHPRSDDKPSGKTTSHILQLQKSTELLKKITTCRLPLSHDRWGLSVKVAEARWAQKQARQRELEEVQDFLQ